MKLDCYQVDAFTQDVFKGNPAAVVVLKEWPDDAVLQSIAAENNLSETAFFVPEGDAFKLRWFTPLAEVDLCGHATLATAHVLFEHLSYPENEVRFISRSGPLTVAREADRYCMDFPAVPMTPASVPDDLIEGFSGLTPSAAFLGADFLAVFAHEDDIVDLDPDFVALSRVQGRGVIATAPGRNCDFVSRVFCPQLGVNEDPVTGSAHCQMAPYWAKRLGRSELSARQVSQRGGNVDC
ncbi:MAG TPA: PhzF family phenazine biosynthesis protein, partial [Wenzhouxiangella sp.]|nr:PhzF family phenazine biosynthesis protein [Wenzhouxiangella sp.]